MGEDFIHDVGVLCAPSDTQIINRSFFIVFSFGGRTEDAAERFYFYAPLDYCVQDVKWDLLVGVESMGGHVE